MKADELKALQSPLKDRYREQPAIALFTMKVQGELRPDKVTCVVLLGVIASNLLQHASTLLA